MEPFRHPPLDETSAPADPMLLFAGWLADVIAAALPEPNAMVLATASASGFPRARTVLLKEHSPAGFIFYTNRTSRKGQHLAARPQACLLFPWYPMQRQVIVAGSVTALSASESEPYFRSRPRGSQLGAWASRQSSVLARGPSWTSGTTSWRGAGPRGRRCRCRTSGAATRSARTAWSSGRAG